MDVTFQEDVPFYSPNGKDVIYDESQGERVPPLVQSVPPPSYFGQIDDNREQGQEKQIVPTSDTLEKTSKEIHGGTETIETSPSLCKCILEENRRLDNYSHQKHHQLIQ